MQWNIFSEIPGFPGSAIKKFHWLLNSWPQCKWSCKSVNLFIFAKKSFWQDLFIFDHCYHLIVYHNHKMSCCHFVTIIKQKQTSILKRTISHWTYIHSFIQTYILLQQNYFLWDFISAFGTMGWFCEWGELYYLRSS